VVLAFVVPVALIIMIVQLITGGLRTDPSLPSMAEDAVAARIKPVGQVNFQAAGAGPAGAAAGARSGEQVYQSGCNACHGAGVLSAPKLGDKGAWNARVAQGKGTLYQHALNGIRAMPARGGNASLADAEVKAAVDYMVGAAK
jgi:cytochrome c5